MNPRNLCLFLVILSNISVNYSLCSDISSNELASNRRMDIAILSIARASGEIITTKDLLRIKEEFREKYGKNPTPFQETNIITITIDYLAKLVAERE